MSEHNSDPSPANASSDPALVDAAEIVGDRWTLQVVDALLADPARFGDLEATVTGISTNVLTDRLRQLEAAGLVRARPYQLRPVRVVYELTEMGAQLESALGALRSWGSRRLGLPERELHHRGCGGVIETRLRCLACGTDVDESETDELRWV